MKSDQVIVSFRGVRKTYDGETLVVKGLDLDIYQGEFLTLLGPSGSGKGAVGRQSVSPNRSPRWEMGGRTLRSS